MKFSNLFIKTKKHVSNEAKMVSHQYMLRGSFIRQLSNGLYYWLPMGLKVIHNINKKIQTEMEKIDFSEILMPSLQPKTIWDKTNRWNKYGDLLLKIQDRNKKNLCYGPTHEECITNLIAMEDISFETYPIKTFQIQTKFRDEIRPRHGVMRSREFIMKDGYSFHYDENDLIKTYNDIKNSYNNIFKSLGIKAVPVQADSGEIGGNASHEFQITCDNGEDILCIDGEKTYNIELAPSAKVYEALEHEITFYSGCYQGKNIGLLVSKTDKINRQKIDNLLISKLKESEFDSNLEMYFVDNALKNCKKFTHLSNAVNILNLNDVKFHDLRNVKENEITPNNNKYKFAKGIEVAHIFQLGDFYSKSFGIKVKEKTPLMGCYGIGVSRIVAAAIEQSHDDKGIIWSYELSPYKIHIVAIDYQKNDSVKIHADEIYNSLKKITDVILDDSHANAGNKMSDANLMGCYLQVIVGPKALAEQKVQLKFRKNQKTKMIEVSNLLNELTEIINHPSLLEKW